MTTLLFFHRSHFCAEVDARGRHHHHHHHARHEPLVAASTDAVGAGDARDAGNTIASVIADVISSRIVGDATSAALCRLFRVSTTSDDCDKCIAQRDRGRGRGRRRRTHACPAADASGQSAHAGVHLQSRCVTMARSTPQHNADAVAGDDIRQDMLAIQIIGLMKRVIDETGLDVYLYPYKVIATRPGCGIIEVVPNARSRDALVSISLFSLFCSEMCFHLVSIQGKYLDGNLIDYFISKYGPGTNFFVVQKMSMLTFVLQCRRNAFCALASI